MTLTGNQEPRIRSWEQAKRATPERLALARAALEDIRAGKPVFEALSRHPLAGGGFVGKQMLVAVYRQLVDSGEWAEDPALLARIRLKPMRSLSGVSVVTVLTKPYPCPGKCVFCPTDVRMPKSYLPDEPGAMRALQHDFDPFQQVASRLQALDAVGHPTDKIEMLILGGTWSSYRRDYQEDFVLRMFAALNGEASLDMAAAQRLNQRAAHRSVGLAIETRPDHVNPEELAWLRYLGVTKVQLGAQSFESRILELNKRGHTPEETRQAVQLLRAAGFKIVLHWMPNLLGATLESDRADFTKLWEGYCPDELKVYPTQLLENAELYLHWQRGEYQPYTSEELVELLADLKADIPEYCRINRVIRDIPSNNVVEGNRRTSLRMDVHERMQARGQRCRCIRCREVRGSRVQADQLELRDVAYSAGSAQEHFLTFVTPEDKLAGFLRLSLPGPSSPATGLTDLDGAALVREVHVYGQSLEMGAEQQGAAQHAGLGTRLLAAAEEQARAAGFRRMAVIAAVGTRDYYAGRGYRLGETYMVKDL
ncbi:MAG: tRNA uridine(34) 5-carboxymethylaminomethyl modification radical SAM/GNAT enzyme Elp3 [Anaerolineales bacterium]|nr:tRNA uridine(34) 5-carboxymethylaminomethyl modification radical SAM/GNAT enzyme Elp3 [Anaerolineales bacterium]MCW5855648.1 tRNA uridine(34) 5-carboxymethylaminomethyl modification radical SAM/GNAT enzyme Elp3 [Anaerolineales bacterium]